MSEERSACSSVRAHANHVLGACARATESRFVSARRAESAVADFVVNAVCGALIVIRDVNIDLCAIFVR